jgi:hypothetical protein
VTIPGPFALPGDRAPVSRGEAGPRGASLLIAAVSVTSLVLLAVTGNAVLAAAPLGAVALVYAFCLLPVRYPLFALVFGAIASEIVPRMGLNNWWRSPLYPINFFLSENLNKLTGIEALRFSGAELVFFTLVVLALGRALLGITTDKAGRVPAANVIFVCSALALASVVFLEFLGMLRGGDFRQSLWQMRELFWLPILVCLFSCAIRGARDFRPLAYAITAATCLKIGIAIYFVLAVAWQRDLNPASVTSHNDSVVFVSVAMIWVAAALHNPTPRVLTASAAVVLWMLIGMALNTRRIAFVGLFAALILAYVVLRGPVKRTVTRAILYGFPFVLLYLALSANRHHGIFTPGSMVVSVLQQKDASSETRDIENYNLLQTLKQNKLLGSGWGHEYNEVSKADDISKFFAQYRYIAHNNILWLWTIGGFLGFTLIWSPIILGFFLARRSYLFARTKMDRAAAMAALGILVSFVIEAWGDMGTQSMNCMLLVAAAIAVSGKLATSTGAWPQGIPLFAGRRYATDSRAP